jgi:hypothetical protein
MAFSDIFQYISVAGLYNDLTGNTALVDIGTTAGGSVVQVGGINPGTGFAQAFHVDASGNLYVNATITPPSDNTATGSITSNQTVTVSTAGTSALMVQVTGTWTGTLTFQASIDGTTWESFNLYPVLPDGTPSTSSTTANGFWQAPVGGFQSFRVLGNTVLTGSASIWLTAGQGQYSVEVVSPVAANFNATVVGTKTNNAAAPNGSNVGALTALANAAAPTNVEGNIVLLSVDLAGNLRVTSTGTSTVAGSLTNNNAAPTNNNLGVLPAVAATSYTTETYTNGDQVLLVTDLHGAINADMQAVAGVQLGATGVTAFGTAPAAVNVQGVNANIYTAGAAIAAGNPLFTNISDGTNVLTANAITAWGTAPTGHVLGVNAEMFAGNTALTATGSSLNVNVTGSSGNITVVGNLTNNNAAPTTTNIGSLDYIATATPEAYTQGNQVLATTSLGGAVRIVPVDEANASSLSYYELTNGNVYVAVTTTFTPVLAWETNSAAFIYLLRMVQVFTSGTVVEFVLLKNPTVVGGAFTAVSGHLSANTTATSYTGGTKVLGGYIGATPFFMDKMLDAMAAGAPGDIFGLEARSIAGTGSVVSAIRWSEQTAAL